GRSGERLRPRIRVGLVVGQLAVRSVDARGKERVSREALDALVRERLDERERVVVRRLEELRVEIAEQPDDVRIPRPPEVTSELVELLFELLLRGHGLSNLSPPFARAPQQTRGLRRQ